MSMNNQDQEVLEAHEAAKSADVIPVCAGCCIISSFYCDMDKCWGCSSESRILCCQTKVIRCKPVHGSDDLCCICQEGSCNIVSVRTCCKGKQQCFCFDTRFALPWDEDIPCMLTIFGFTACFKYACTPRCCVKISDLDEAQGNTVPVQTVVSNV